MLETIGYDSRMARTAPSTTEACRRDLRIGRVLRMDRAIARVLTEDGHVRVSLGSTLLGEIAKDTTAAPCTGDFVTVRDWPDHKGTVDSVLPRRTALIRATAGEQSVGQVLCANLDFAALVVSLHPAPSIGKVERLLALAWESGAQPVVVLTKSDAVSDAVLIAEDVAAAAPGVEVITSSVVTGEGICRIRQLISGRYTMALLGSSGHGKSSLTNALVGAEVMTTRGIRKDGRGRHTSARRELVVLSDGGAVIDTPGLKGVGLIDVRDGLAQAFSDFDVLVATCRFADCRHRSEPDCAVTRAVEEGALTLRRLESWQKLQRELDWMASRKDARLRAQRSRWRKGAGRAGTAPG